MSVLSAARAAKSRALLVAGLAVFLVLASVQVLMVLPARADTSVIALKPQHAGSTNPGFANVGTCPQSPPLWGWHFILDGNDHEFVSLTATFATAGVVTYTGPFGPPTAKHAYLHTTGPDTLVTAVATVSGPPTTDDFQLSHVCAGGTAPSPSPSPSPSGSPSSSPSPSGSPSSSPSPSGSPSPSPSQTVSESPSPSPSQTVSESPSVSPSEIVSESPSPSPSASESPEVLPTEIVSESPAPSDSPEVEASETTTPGPVVSGVKLKKNPAIGGRRLPTTGTPVSVGLLLLLGLGLVALGFAMTVAPRTATAGRHRRR